MKNIILFFLRIFVICKSHPRLVPILIAIVLGRLPFFKYSEKGIKSSLDERQTAKQKGKSVGHVECGIEFSLQVFGITIMSLLCTEHFVLNFWSFFIHRKASLVQQALSKAKELGVEIEVFRGMKIFEPGCNAGKLLFYFMDKYDAEVRGADVFEPAIEVAREADIFKKGRFDVADLVKSDYLSKIPDNYFDCIIVSSHLSHIIHFGDETLENYFSELIRIGKQMLIIEKKNEKTIHLFKEHGLTFSLSKKYSTNADSPMVLWAFLKKAEIN